MNTTFLEGLFSAAQCGGEDDGGCRDDVAALQLKAVAIASILVAGVVGVGIPLVGRSRITDSGVYSVFKAFAAGVVLATGFVHMLPDGEDALSDPCLPDTPWKEFPFAGFVAMAAALCTLVLDFLGTQYYERKRRQEEEENGGDYHEIENGIGVGRSEAFSHVHGHGHDHGHGHSHVVGGETSTKVRHVVASQILELGIVSHSIIIGLSLGVSNSPCTIRPLIAALSFHQFFEGIALGGCISQADFNTYVTTTMACFFAVTTPAGVAVGASLASLYNANSPRALVVEGLLDCVSAGILIYMALVELIAADFLSRNMSTKFWSKLASFVALFLGATSMSLLAIWA